MKDDDEPQYAYCAKCGKVSFLCRCDEDDSVCADCVSDDADCENYEEITICAVCEAPISDDADPGIDMHFCEECTAAVCSNCARPVVDESGEMYFLCKKCLEGDTE